METAQTRAPKARRIIIRLPTHPIDYYRYVYQWIVWHSRHDRISRTEAIERFAKQFGEPIDKVKAAFKDGRRMDATIERAGDDTGRKIFRAMRTLLVEGRPKRDAAVEVAKRFDIAPGTATNFYGRWRRFDPNPLDLAEIRASQSSAGADHD